MSQSFIRRFSPESAEPMEWLVLVGDDGAIEHLVRMCVPDEKYVRRLLRIAEEVPILIGRP
ncbi:MAG TPA: hypothetical protein PLN95_02340 [Candidatus Saccharibacteria bacterium]|nr:hypothetical protein [Candidatus Saccharibacteria bacterium]